MNNPNNYPYLPNTDEDRLEMLMKIGVASFEELLSHIPQTLRSGNLKLNPGLSEMELKATIQTLAEKNVPVSCQASFLGGGSYYRYIPAVVSNLSSRSEFLTAYTPYQPEVSQGSLQAIYEFQTAICRLTGMEVANASMYDGPTACAEACMMAYRIIKKNKIVFSQSLNPEYKNVIKTYVQACNLEYVELGNTIPVLTDLPTKVLENASCLVIQSPNYLGCLEDLTLIKKIQDNYGCLVIVVCDPVTLAVLEPPGSFGADIVVGDGETCGNGLSFGGPSAGFMATKQIYVRQLPGRIVGETQDKLGNRAFTLTLQTREQHIRRASANSNICTNQALNALTMLIYLTALGPNGLKDLNNLSFQRAKYLATGLNEITGVELYFKEPFVNEFVIKTTKDADEVLKLLLEHNILGGIALEHTYPQLKNCIMIAVTEMNPKEQLDKYINALAQIINFQPNKKLAKTSN